MYYKNFFLLGFYDFSRVSLAIFPQSEPEKGEVTLQDTGQSRGQEDSFVEIRFAVFSVSYQVEMLNQSL